MVDTNSHRRPSPLFGVGVVLLILAMVVLVLVGDRSLPAPVDDRSSLDAVAALLVLSLAATLGSALRWVRTERSTGVAPFGRIPELENELRGLVEDYASAVESYRAELDRYSGPSAPQFGVAREELNHIDSQLEEVTSRLADGRYVAAFREYYRAKRNLFDVAPALMLVDDQQGMRRNRLAELVDQARSYAKALPATPLRAETLAELDAYRAELDRYSGSSTETATTVSLSPLKSNARRIHGAWLDSLDRHLRLRSLVVSFNALMTGLFGVMILGVAAVAVLAFVDGGAAAVTAVTGLPPDALSSVVFVVLVLFLGAFGAGLNLYRRFGGTVILERGPVLPELPNGLVMRPLVRSRILWGAATAFVVYVFTLFSLGGDPNPLSLVLIAIAAGFSEQLLDRVLERQQARIAGLTEESTDPSKSPQVDGSASNTNGAGRLELSVSNDDPTETAATGSKSNETKRADDAVTG